VLARPAVEDLSAQDFGVGGGGPGLKAASFVHIFRGLKPPAPSARARAVLQFMCSVSLRARWLFLKEKAIYHRAFGVRQLENRYKTPYSLRKS